MTDQAEQEFDEMVALVQQANRGDESALPRLKENHPHGYEAFLAWYEGNADRDTQQTVLRAYTNEKHLALRGGLEHRLEQLRGELEGTQPSSLEKLLVERVLCCWLDINLVERLCAHKHSEGGSFKAMEFYQRWQGRSHRRFLAACKALAQVRKLLGVNVQINIAEKQINNLGKCE